MANDVVVITHPFPGATIGTTVTIAGFVQPVSRTSPVVITACLRVWHGGHFNYSHASKVTNVAQLINPKEKIGAPWQFTFNHILTGPADVRVYTSTATPGNAFMSFG